MVFLSKVILFITILFLINFGKVNSTTYTCNVDQNSQINTTSPNYCSFETTQSQTCLKIIDCVKSFNSLGDGNIYNIGLANSLYSFDGNCELILETSSNWFFRTLQLNSTIDCESNGSFIKSSVSSMTFSNLIIANTNSSAIISDPSGSQPVVTVSHVDFYNCSSTDGDGGAIRSHSPNTIIMYSQFFNCSSRSRGGAVWAQSSSIHGCLFSKCSANDGGAIYSSQATIRNAAFMNNNAYNGGAISTLELTIQGSIIRNNSAFNGGAFYIQGIQSQFTDFYYNFAVDGGAIYLYNTFSNSLLNQSKIYNNTALNNGGAIYIKSPQNNGKLDLTGSSIYENIANNYAGAIYFNTTRNPFIFMGKIYNNTAMTQENSKQQELACDRFSHVNCNLCGIQNCNICQQNNGICIKIKTKSNNNSSSSGGSGSGSGTSENSSEHHNNSSSSNSISSELYSVFENEYEFDEIYSSEHLCLLTSFGCNHGKCSLFVNSTTKDQDFKCECQDGFYGSECTEGSTSLSSSSSEGYDSSSSNNNNDDGSNNNNNGISKNLLALEISLPIVLGFLIIVFIVVLYFVLKRKDEIVDINNDDIKPLLINDNNYDQL